MFEQVGSTGGVATAKELFATKVAPRDDESRLAATLRITRGAADAAPVNRHAPEDVSNRVAVEMARAIEARMPGRIRDLSVCVERDQFVLRGVSCSYYVKQVAGHLAMTAMDARLLSRLVNEIEVRSVR